MFLCFYVARTQLHVEKVGSCAWKPTIVQTLPAKRICLSVGNISFSRSKGRGPVFLAVICLTSGSVVGQCQVEQRSRIPPANPELNATPSLHEACHEQSRYSMPANDFCSRKREEGRKNGKKKSQGRWFWLHLYKLLVSESAGWWHPGSKTCSKKKFGAATNNFHYWLPCRLLSRINWPITFQKTVKNVHPSPRWCL